MVLASPGNCRRTPDSAGRTPRHGEVSAYARTVGLARLAVRDRLRRGKLHVGDDGLIYPRPEPSAAPAEHAEPLAPARLNDTPSMSWAERRAAFETMAVFLIDGRPDGVTVEDAAHALAGNVRAALGAVLRGSVS